jgi:16S rRNA G966 N2-methylase RsmD
VVSQLIERYSGESETVLDSFCGSGVVGIEAIRLGRSFVGVDLNPMAVRVSRDALSRTFDVRQFDESFQFLHSAVSERINALFELKGDLLLYSLPNARDGANAVTRGKGSRVVRKKVDLAKLPSVRITADDRAVLPSAAFPNRFYKDRFSYKGVRLVTDLFSRRCIKGLAILWKQISELPLPVREQFELCFTNTLLHVSKLKSERVRPLGVNNYWIPDDFIEENVWWRFENRCNQYRKAKLSLAQHLKTEASANAVSVVRVGDARFLDSVETASVDYVLTDPPYGDAIQYSELSYVWNAWLGEKVQTAKEIVVNPCQNKLESRYMTMLNDAFGEVRRVLKKDKLFTLAFQSKDLELWRAVAVALRNQGFEFEDIFADNMLGSPFTKNWSAHSPKSDIYLTLVNRKQSPRLSETLLFSEVLKSARTAIMRGKLKRERAYDFVVMKVITKTLDGVTVEFETEPTIANILSSLTD